MDFFCQGIPFHAPSAPPSSLGQQQFSLQVGVIRTSIRKKTHDMAPSHDSSLDHNRHSGRRLDRILFGLACAGLAMLAASICEALGIWEAFAGMLAR